jgi:hypothetical protein
VAPVHRITKLPRRTASQVNEEKVASVPEQPSAAYDKTFQEIGKSTEFEGTSAIEASAGNITDETIGRFREAVESIRDAPPETKSGAERPSAETVVIHNSTADSGDGHASSVAEHPSDNSHSPQPKSIAAEEFVLVDSRGERRAALALASDGAPALTLNDAAGTARAAVRLNFEGAPSVVLYDAIGRRRLEVALKPDGTTGIGLYDEAGEGRAELVVAPSGSPSLTLFGPNGRRISRLPNTRER